MLKPVRITAPATAVVSTVDARAWMRVDDAASDDIIAALVDAATARLDGYSGLLRRCLVTQTWRQDFPEWPATGQLALPFHGVSAVTVKYSDADNAEQTVSTSLYELLEGAAGSFIRFGDAFTEPAVYDDRSDAVRVTMTVGYGAAAAVPPPIVTAIKMLAAHWYEHREAASAEALNEIPMGVKALLAPYRMVGV